MAIGLMVVAALALLVAFVWFWLRPPPPGLPPPRPGAPMPMVASGRPVDWWFAYKFSARSFPLPDDAPHDGKVAPRGCRFGGTVRHDGNASLRYVMASSGQSALRDGPGLIGTGLDDPLGATFDTVWHGHYYVVWNDQFYNDPVRHGFHCDGSECGKPWGHSKGMLAWDMAGNGLLLHVTTPSWPGSGSARVPRVDGNTLGCISDDNNIANAQDFFALRLSRADVKIVLMALARASVSTDIANPQIVARVVDGHRMPPDIDGLVTALGQISDSPEFLDTTLSSGVRLIVKPSALHVPPWQFVSSRLGGEALLTATWWAPPRIGPTRSADDVHCWDRTLDAPGRVDIAYASAWEGAPVAFTGGPNHGKLAVSEPGGHDYTILGDLNQQGQLGDRFDPDGAVCDSSQNGRGGMFFVLRDKALHDSVAKMLSGRIVAYGP